ncbi:MAG: hypothetical protein MSA90_06910 [Faecalicatena sp.]|uniref:hypothetical protein n=1 Tax=Faecalicatena sp. TaxID=2005360 RepID=UPI00258D0125|nr:hypothetical protein [Faecalicatena sp.]MCI6465181.1 hypothetical protein [Faecalicatena sp.]MCI7179126.1 hypothetical protein [Lachnospiraceae bacterium]MDY5620602.1 hypothetical protein [Lachnospiraceae bacterium]
MLDLLREDYGEYVLGFFVISLDMQLSEDIFQSGFTREDFATFVHEYIHFLQNITTTYGVVYFNDNSKIIQLFISESYKHDERIPYPLIVDESGVENVIEEMELRSFYYGNCEQKRIHHINEVKVEKDEIIELVIPGGNLESVNIYYDDKEYPYCFGAACIQESMAYLIESEKFYGIKRTNELPYNSCELVCQKLCPDLEGRKDIIVALAELSLMHYHSGKMFVELLEYIKVKEKKFKNTIEVAEYFKEKIPHLFDNYERAYRETKDSIDFLYPSETPFVSVNDWLNEMMIKGFHFRNEYCNLISRMMDFPTTYVKEYFEELVKLFEMPALSDKNCDIYSGNCDLSLALVPIAVYNEYMGKDKQCYLYEHCKKSKVSVFGDNCKNAPWLQSLQERLCPFGLFWSYYSLDGKSIEK